MTRESQYVEPYLEEAARHRYTVGTFLRYRLRGRARDWSDVYQRSLERALARRLIEGEVVIVRSAKGGDCYLRRVDVRPNEPILYDPIRDEES